MIKLIKAFISTFLIFNTLLVSFVQAEGNPQHLGIQISSDALRVALKSALDLMYDGKENAVMEYKAGKITKNFKLDNPQYGKMVSIIDELFSLSAAKGVTVNVKHSAAQISGYVGEQNIKYTLTKQANEKFQINLNVTIADLKVLLPSLMICADINYKDCKGGNFVKFKDIVVGLNKNTAPVKISLVLDVSLNPVIKMVKGQKVQTKAISLKMSKITSNLDTPNGPQVRLSYFKGIANGIEYPAISANQVGPAGFGLSFSSKDLISEIDLYKNQMGKQIISTAHDFIAKDLVKFINNILEDREFSSDFWVSYTGTHLPKSLQGQVLTEVEDTNNEYQAKIDTVYVYRIKEGKNQSDIMSALSLMVHDMTYGIKLDDVSLPTLNGKQFLNFNVDTDLFLNGQKFKPSSTKGYGTCQTFNFNKPEPVATPDHSWGGAQPAQRDNTYVKPPVIYYGQTKSYVNCEKPLLPLNFESSKMSLSKHNLAFGVSESYINSLLKLADDQGLIKKLVKLQMNKPGVYIGQDGIKLHVYKNQKGSTFAYLIVNMIVKLSEQPSWLDRNVGGFIEEWWGNTGGIVRFPLEIPIWFKLKETAQGQKIVLEGLSPFGSDGHLVNTFGYPSNINSAADTWLVDIQEKIEGKIKESLSDLVDPNLENVNGRKFLKSHEIAVAPMLGTLPADFKLTNISLEESGHVVIYGQMSKLDLKPLVQGRK
jgi:hypothetical protein